MAKFTLYQPGDNIVAALRPKLAKSRAPMTPRTFGALLAGWFLLAFVTGLAVLAA
jgi:hypothetical protein